MSTLRSKRFWVESLERAVKTAAQFALVVVGQDAAGLDWFSADWKTAVGSALGGAAISLLTSLASAQVGDPQSPSVV